LFQAARWKAYLKNLQNVEKERAAGDGNAAGTENIYQIFHSQMLWFTRDEGNGHQKAANEHMERCDGLLEDCSKMVGDLEETLANTPKPSEVLDWSRLW
jgi:hypothetical protein